VAVQYGSFLGLNPFIEGGGNFETIGGGQLFATAAALGNNDAGILVGWSQGPDIGAIAGIAIPLALLTGPQPITPVAAPFPFQLHSWN